MTDITLGQPLGGFYWRGTIPGQLCGATVTWACTYESDEPIAIPPFIDYAGQHVIVTNQLPEGLGVPSYVSPGVLTLTPTVTCPNPDPGGDPIATVLDPLTLTIAGSGGCDFCPYPENPGFETGIATPWFFGDAAVISEDVVHTGTYSVYLPLNGSTPGYISQSKTVCPPYPANIDLDFYVYGGGHPSDTHAVDVIIEQYQDSSVLDITEFPNQWVVVGEWTLISVSVPSQSTMNILTIKVANAGEDGSYVDDFTMNLCPCTPVIPAFPLNPGFETGSLSPWTSTHGEISTTQPHAGTYSFSFSDEAPVNVTLTQEIMGFDLCAAMDLTMQFYAQPRFVDNTLSYNVELLDSGGGVLYTLQRTDISSPTGVWTHHNANMVMGEATALQTKGFRINVTTNADDMYVDDFTFVLT